MQVRGRFGLEWSVAQRNSKAIWKAMTPEKQDAEWLRRGNLYAMRQQNLTTETTPLEALEIAEAEQAEEARARAERARQEQALANFDAMGLSPLSSSITPEQEQARIHDLAEKDAIGRGIKLGEHW